ncbi:MAG: hypothetical protein ABSH22_19885 [Tepidisphaeraceae bacterium]|jgi:hypothetical protein
MLKAAGFRLEKLSQPFSGGGRSGLLSRRGVHASAPGIEHSVEVMQHRQSLAGVFEMNPPNGVDFIIFNQARFNGFGRCFWKSRFKIPRQMLH